ncbi:MAG TPA: hypothetical protein VLT86_09185 [Vicinamibacterales bacterium]|nr:hypothetical protein [Vicinamibacterales bacterium]
MLIEERTTPDKSRRITIRSTAAGWEVRKERDGREVSRVTYLDWHRVERALQLFEEYSSQASTT